MVGSIQGEVAGDEANYGPLVHPIQDRSVAFASYGVQMVDCLFFHQAVMGNFHS